MIRWSHERKSGRRMSYSNVNLLLSPLYCLTGGYTYLCMYVGRFGSIYPPHIPTRLNFCCRFILKRGLPMFSLWQMHFRTLISYIFMIVFGSAVISTPNITKIIPAKKTVHPWTDEKMLNIYSWIFKVAVCFEIESLMCVLVWMSVVICNHVKCFRIGACI